MKSAQLFADKARKQRVVLCHFRSPTERANQNKHML